MKLYKIYIFVPLVVVSIVGLRFLLIQKPDTRLLYTVQHETLLETVQVSGIFHKTASDTEKAAAYTAYQNAISLLTTANQNKRAEDATMWTKRQAILTAENNINYKNDHTINPSTKNEYTDLEKMSLESALVQAHKDFQAAESQYKEAGISIAAANAQVNLAKIAYEDTLENDPLLTVYVNEIYAPRISAGQKVSIIFDAFKDKILTGKVKSIDTIGTNTGGSVTFEVKIQIDDIPANLSPNMTAIASIEMIHKENTLTIPMSAVIYKDGKTYIKKAESKNDQLTEIQIGEKGFVKAEVLSGITSGTKLLARPNSKSL